MTNPDEVDYIDAYGLGRWGEGHGLVLEKQDNLESVIRQITESYARHFKKSAYGNESFAERLQVFQAASI